MIRDAVGSLAGTTEAQHSAVRLAEHFGDPEGWPRLAAATGVYILRGGRGGIPRAKRAALVSAHTTATAATMTAKRAKIKTRTRQGDHIYVLG